MDLFGILRVTVQVTWLPRQKTARQQAAPVNGATSSQPAPSTAALTESAVSDPVTPPPVPREPPGPDPPLSRTALPAGQEAVVRSLISLADDLAGLARGTSGDGTGDRALRLARWRVDQALAECGVQAVDDGGPVDPGRHEVVGSRPADAGGTAGWIAATIRPGYLAADGELIRPQQVVAYSADRDTGGER